MTVRTAKINSIDAPVAAWTNACTVPAGQTYLIKDIRVVNLGGGSDSVSVRARVPGGVQVELFYGVTLADSATYGWEGWVVLAPADILEVFSTAGLSNFWISGTKLVGVAL